MKIKIETALEYGIMLLHDPYNDVQFPEDTGIANITYTDSCICFQVASYINGNANVTLSDAPYSTVIRHDFERKILSRSKYIGLTDVPVNYYGILAIKDDFADIKIWNYNDNEQEFSWVQIGNLVLF